MGPSIDLSVQFDEGPEGTGERAGHGTGSCTIVSAWVNLSKQTRHPIVTILLQTGIHLASLKAKEASTVLVQLDAFKARIQDLDRAYGRARWDGAILPTALHLLSSEAHSMVSQQYTHNIAIGGCASPTSNLAAMISKYPSR